MFLRLTYVPILDLPLYVYFKKIYLESWKFLWLSGTSRPTHKKDNVVIELFLPKIWCQECFRIIKNLIQRPPRAARVASDNQTSSYLCSEGCGPKHRDRRFSLFQSRAVEVDCQASKLISSDIFLTSWNVIISV